MTKRWAACRCFYMKNFYIPQLDEHLEYYSDQQFLSDCKNFKNANPDILLEEVKSEMQRRKSRFKVVEDNRKKILETYKSPSVESFSGFCDFWKSPPIKILDDFTEFQYLTPTSVIELWKKFVSIHIFSFCYIHFFLLISKF